MNRGLYSVHWAGGKITEKSNCETGSVEPYKD